MVNYNPRDWFGLIFRFHKSDTFRKLFWVIVSVSLYSWLMIYVELEIFEMNFSSTAMHSLLGFVISLLLVFRTNTAYDRWWEGRKQWGSLVNLSRNFTLKLRTFVGNEQAAAHMIHLTSMYPYVLKEHLREGDYSSLPEAIRDDLNAIINRQNHAPNALALEMHRQLAKASRNHALETAEYLALLNDVKEFTDICGACERINKTPIPYNYNIFIKKFIFVYIVTMPISFAVTFQYWTILVTAFTFYTLASLELIAESIEEPFGRDPDDLPTDDLSDTIRKNLDEIVAQSPGPAHI